MNTNTHKQVKCATGQVVLIDRANMTLGGNFNQKAGDVKLSHFVDGWVVIETLASTSMADAVSYVKKLELS